MVILSPQYVSVKVYGQYVIGIMVRLYRACRSVNEPIYHPFQSYYSKVSVFPLLLPISAS